MNITKRSEPTLKDMTIFRDSTPEERQFSQELVHVKQLYRGALTVALTQLNILDDEFATMHDHSPIHHTESRIKNTDSIIKKLTSRNLELTVDNVFSHITDMAGVRVICNYLDDIYYLVDLIRKFDHFKIVEEVDYIKNPKESGYRSFHIIVNVPVVTSEGYMELPVEVQLRTIAQDMWASLEHELRYKSDRVFDEHEAYRLRLCSDAISEIDEEMQNIFYGQSADYDEKK